MRFNKLKQTLLSAALAFSLFLGSGTLPAAANQSAFQHYQVFAGDTLWLLAQRYGTTVEELTKLNALTGSELSPGQQLFIPVAFEQGKVRYTVQKGDTLFLIAQRTGQSVEDIQKASQINTDELYSGQTLDIPAAKPGHSSYLVKPGESLFTISRDQKVSLDALQQTNHLSGSAILAGQILELPFPTAFTPPKAAESPGGVTLYRVQPGDTLGKIASWFATTGEAIYSTNKLSSDILMPGQPLYIPKGRTAVDVEGPKGMQNPKYGEFFPWEWARWVYNPGAVATIIDWQTGKKFKVRHLGGSNHADSEPLTAADTAVMASLYPKGWSWSTRPVLLQVGSRVLAASIAGMPHSVETIGNNKFSGHFDLYFYNSRSHNTNRIKADHQNNILAAAGLSTAEASTFAAKISSK